MEKKYTSSEVLVCGECKGEGSIVIQGACINQHKGEYEDPITLTCKLCNGSGMVTVSKLTIVTVTPKHPTPCM